MKDRILQAFPKLSSDIGFKITSPQDPNYNCIAYAGVKTNIKWWPHPQPLDGIEWPFNLPIDDSLDTFTQLFEKLGYSTCDSWEFEHQFMKIAIYQCPTTLKCKHAARQTINGNWTSKLGDGEDIEHGDPFSVEGAIYGQAVRFMKRENKSFVVKQSKMAGKKR